MPLITWNDNLSVKVRQFDDDHKKLIELINQLFDAMIAGKGKDVLGGILESLISYTKSHFAAEEKLMLMHNYSGYEEHKKHHTQLVAQVQDFHQKFQAGAALSTELMNFLKDWLNNHIKTVDQKYGPFFNGKGIA